MGFLLIYTSLRAKGLTVYPVCPHRTPNVNFFVSKREFDYKTWIFLLSSTGYFNPLNAELNPIRHLLTLVGAKNKSPYWVSSPWPVSLLYASCGQFVNYVRTIKITHTNLCS